MTDTKNDQMHCGFTNYETFLTAIYLDNNEFPVETEGLTKHELAENLRDYVETMVEEKQEYGHSLLYDLLSAAVERVDWIDVAEHILSE